MFSTVARVLLAPALLAGSFLAAAPAGAEMPSWAAEPVPGRANNVLGPPGIDIRDLAAAGDGLTLYAAAGDSLPGNTLYKSTDGGRSWHALDIPVAADLVAVAPDNAGVVAIAGKEEPAVYISTNGGSGWQSPGTVRPADGIPASAIHAIAVSPARRETRYLAVAGEETGNNGNLWYVTTGGPSSTWEEAGGLPGFRDARAVKAVAFSPAFSTDGLLVTVGESENRSAHAGMFSFLERKWNGHAGFPGYPATVIDADGVNGLASASIVLHPGRGGDGETPPTVFLGLAIDGDAGSRAAGGLYRLAETGATALKTGAGIHSLDFDGSRLVAGGYRSNTVYRSANPLAQTPRVDSSHPLKSPGGEERVVVVSNEAGVVAGTSGNESAVAISGDSGGTFTDVGLVDTTLTHLTDIAITADESRVYLAADDGADFSLWRKTSFWERVLSRPATAGYIVRAAPGDDDAVYLAERNSRTVYFSPDAGKTEWLVRNCNVNIQDLAVASPEAVYALNRVGEVAGSGTAGKVWRAPVPTGLDRDTGHMITSAGPGYLLAGSTNGYVAYSTDGNTSWTRIPQALHGAARKIQVVADNDFATNKVIYAASSKETQKIKKWTIGGSGGWTEITGSVVPGGVYGLAADSGVLYALEFDPYRNRSALWRLLSPATAGTTPEWKVYRTAPDSGVRFDAAPRALKLSSMGKLWAIATGEKEQPYSLTDVMTELALESPKPGFISPVNPVTGIASEVSFRWRRWDAAAGYRLEIALDPGFTRSVTRLAIDSEQSTVTVRMGPEREGDRKVHFNPGTRYYWRVKVTRPRLNLYTETRSFGIETLEVPSPLVIERPPPVTRLEPPEVIVQWPDINLPPAAAPEIPPLNIVVPASRTPSPETPAYVWIIIAFGALSAIAVLVVAARRWLPPPSAAEPPYAGDTAGIVAWVKDYLGIDAPNQEMTDDDIRRVIRFLAEQAPDTTWEQERPVPGRIGSGSIALIIKTEFPEYHARHNREGYGPIISASGTETDD